MSKDILRLQGGIIARIALKRRNNYDVSGSFKKYAFKATVYDTNKTCGIMGSRITGLEMWRAKKTITGYIKVFPILCCHNGNWTLKARSGNDYNASCDLIYVLNQMLPKSP